VSYAPPTLSPTKTPTQSPTQSPTLSLLPTLTSAPSSLSSVNILGYGSMEERANPNLNDPAGDRIVLSQWVSRCNRTVTNEPGFTHKGDYSLSVPGNQIDPKSGQPVSCFLIRPIGPGCGPGRVSSPLMPGDVVVISLWVMLDEPGTFQMYTGHYHDGKGRRKWALPKDVSCLWCLLGYLKYTQQP